MKIFNITTLLLIMSSYNLYAKNFDHKEFGLKVKACFSSAVDRDIFYTAKNRDDFQFKAVFNCEGKAAQDLYEMLPVVDTVVKLNDYYTNNKHTFTFGKNEVTSSTRDGQFFSLRGLSFVTDGSRCSLERGVYECSLEFKMTLNEDLSSEIRDDAREE